MDKIKIGIVEDEVIIADSLSHTLRQLKYDVAEPVASYSQALEMIESEKPDLLLIDIHLSGSKDGIDLAWKIKEDYDLPFIFLTANADPATVDRAKNTEPPAYLVKPFNKDDLFTSIEICFHNYNKRKEALAEKSPEKVNYAINDALFIKDGNYFHKVMFSDIRYLESDHVYVIVHTADKKILVRDSMHHYILNFDPRNFFRVHRSYVVNLQHVDTINTDNVIVKGTRIPIGKTFRDELLSRLRLG